MSGRTKPVPDPAQRDVFDSGARARSRDPETSKAAAQSVRNLRDSHRRIVAMFKLYGDMTDETLLSLLNSAARETGFKPMSPSGVRSRRSELSKPNTDRLDEIAAEFYDGPLFGAFSRLPDEAARTRMRGQLRAEGFKSELWDTGKREALASGRQAIVWGIAR